MRKSTSIATLPTNAETVHTPLPKPPQRPAYREAHKAPLCDFPVRDEILYEYLRLPPNGEVLEVGPGTGYTAYWLAPQVRRLTLLDIAGSTLRELETRLACRPNVGFLCWDICSPGLPDLLGSTFDAVYGLDFFEYVGDPQVALANLRGVLRQGGMLLLSYPNFSPGTSDGIHYFRTRDEAAANLREAGFRRWEIFTIRLRPWARSLFIALHEWPIRLHRRYRPGSEGQPNNFDATWFAQNSRRWERRARWIHPYWHGLSALMRFGGEAYRVQPADHDIVGTQLVIRAWR